MSAQALTVRGIGICEVLRGRWQRGRVCLLVDADVVRLAHGAEIELLGRVLNHGQVLGVGHGSVSFKSEIIVNFSVVDERRL